MCLTCEAQSRSVVMGVAIRTQHGRSAEEGQDQADIGKNGGTVRGEEIVRVQAGVGCDNSLQ